MKRFLKIFFAAAVLAHGYGCGMATAQTKIVGPKAILGPKTNVDKDIVFDINNGSANPVIRAEDSSGRLKFSNDGTNFKSFGSGSGGGSGINLLSDNADFESGSGFWTNSGGTWTVYQNSNPSAPNYDPTKVLFETASGSFTASGSGQYVETTAYLVPDGLKNGSCLARIWMLGGDENLKLQVLDGSSNVLQINGQNVEIVFTAAIYNTTAKTVSVGFKCPSSGSIKLRVTSTAAAAAVLIDNAKLGDDDRFVKTTGLTGAWFIDASIWKTSSTNISIGGTTGSYFVPDDGSLEMVPASGSWPVSITCSSTNAPATPSTGTTTCSSGNEQPGISFIPPQNGIYRVCIDMSVYQQQNSPQRSQYFKLAQTSPTSQTITTEGGTNWVSETGSSDSGYQMHGAPQNKCGVFWLTGGTQAAIRLFLYQATALASSSIYLTTSSASPSANVRFTVEQVFSTTDDLYFNATAPNDLTYVNEFSALVTDGSPATVSRENVDWLGSTCTRNGNGDYTCAINSGIFSVTPNCEARHEGSSAIGARVYSISNSSISIQTYNTTNTTLTNANFVVSCSKQGSDYKTRASILGYIPKQKRVAVLSDVKSNGTGGGSTASSYTGRNLNTVVDPTSIIVNSASFTGTGGTNATITLNEGTYRISASAPLFNTSAASMTAKLRLQNTTDGTSTLIGQSCNTVTSATAGQVPCLLNGIFTIGSQKSFEVQMRASSTSGSLGQAMSFGDNEVYAIVEIEKMD